MGRLPTNNNNSIIDSELKKGPWTPEEDQKLIDYVRKHGHGSWQLLPKKAGLNRCGKSCRLRWTNYLKPDIKRGNFLPEEEQTIINLHSILGNKWATIATRLPGRTDNEIKNFWNTQLRKKLMRSGIDPNTHQPITHDHNHLNLLLNLPPLFPNSNFNNPTMKNPFDNLAKIRLLCNMLQIMNPNPVPNFLGLGSSHNFNQLEGLYHGISSTATQFSNMAIPNMEQFDLLHNNFQFQPNLDKFSFPDDYDNKNNGTIGRGSNNTSSEYSLPALVQAAPDISSDVKLITDEIPKYDELLGICSDSVNNSSWGTVTEDEASSSFWKDIFTESSSL